jgi:hypothetical protein
MKFKILKIVKKFLLIRKKNQIKYQKNLQYPLTGRNIIERARGEKLNFDGVFTAQSGNVQ